MSWFVFALICVLGWGLADIFYKKGAEEDDDYSHLKQGVWVGLVMGVCAIALMPISETKFSFATLASDALSYSPASISYIISMVIGYAGLRYLELSIVSPVQNASGAFSMIFMLIYFVVTGHAEEVTEQFSVIDFVGLGTITIGLIALAIVGRKLSEREAISEGTNDRKYKIGAKALLFPLGYCLFDTIGTTADGIILSDETGLGLGEIDVIILYGLTFFLVGIIMWIILRVKTGRFYNPFAKSEISKGAGAICEEVGQIFYVYAMARNPLYAAPMVASYCVISVLLSRIFLKEKLEFARYASIGMVIIGILALGISEGLGA